MLFNSWIFLLFFAVVYPLYRILPHRAQNRMLLGASWLFYGWWDWRFLGLLLFTSGVDWAVGRALEDPERRGRKWILAISLVVNLGVLALFKYLAFFFNQVNAVAALLGMQRLLPVLHLLVPVGLSFYTFQSIAYTVDVYRGTLKAVRNFWDFSLFVAFFPHLVAGPIQRSGDLLPQIQNPRVIRREAMDSGSWLMLWGYFKKVFVADNLATIVSDVYEKPGGVAGLSVGLAMLAFTFQIYCDFSGYSDIARGLSRWLGVELMENFRRPFFAASPQELWHRWHISLSRWLRDYLYIPLGGNRQGPWRTRLNLLLTMLLGGFWHGANWTFVVWGGIHGIALVLQRGWEPKGALRKAVGIVCTFALTTVAFSIFRAHDLGHVQQLFTTLFHGGAVPADGHRARQILAVTAPLILGEVILEWRPQWLTSCPRLVQAVVAAALFWATMVLGASFGQQFIYFQF